MTLSALNHLSAPHAAADAPASTEPMRIALVTDAWHPQVNGVVRTWTEVCRAWRDAGHAVDVIEPSAFRTMRMPRYPEIRLALGAARGVRRRLDTLRPDAIHIATEGPLGCAARRYCSGRALPFTTSYHTQFPLYLQRYAHIPARWTYRFIRWFHGHARAVLVPTQRVGDELRAAGLDNTVVWTRGVDTALFDPARREPTLFGDLPRPIFLYAGRVAIEKNIEAFLDADLPGAKAVVGDGPAKATLQRRYRDVHWAGYQFGEALAAHYASADALVFPSRTDTFGVVMLEANACGLPVAAFPVTGPIDVIKPGVNGVLDDDLATACREALTLDRNACRSHALGHSWTRCADMAHERLARIQW